MDVLPLPDNCSVFETWPQIRILVAPSSRSRSRTVVVGSLVSSGVVVVGDGGLAAVHSRCVAFRCINQRLAIAMGDRRAWPAPTTLFGDDVVTDPRYSQFRTVEQVFAAHGGGFIVLHSIEDAKRAIWTTGPVVCTDFVLRQAYLDTLTGPEKETMGLILGQTGGVHPLLLLGWVLDPEDGKEYWLARSVAKNSTLDIRVPIDQFFSDNGTETVVYPADDFSNTPMHPPAEAFDTTVNDDGWMKWILC
jgi:hypothetical protein